MNVSDEQLAKISRELRNDMGEEHWRVFWQLVEERIAEKTNAVIQSRDPEGWVAYERGYLAGAKWVTQFLNDTITKHGTVVD